MSKLGLAFKAFFSTLKTGAATSADARTIEEPKPARSEALTLLATLQREARLVDFLMEPLESYSDQQVAAAVRDIQLDSRKTLQRIFALEPLRNEAEGEKVTIPEGFDAAEFKLTGTLSGEPPYSAELVHPGWKASKVNMPVWNGSEASAKIIASAEVEI